MSHAQEELTAGDAGAAYRSIWKYLYRTPHTLAFADVDGYGTRYLEAGDPDKPHLLLLHGTAGSLENFCANIAAYAEHFHVIAMDMLGCGWTDKPDTPVTPTVWARHAVGLMDHLGIERASIVGVSLGSFVAVRLAHDFPGRADRIVMVAPAGIITDPEYYKEYSKKLVDRRQKAGTDPHWDGVKVIFRNLLLKEEDIIDDLVAIRLDIYRNPEMQRAMPLVLAPRGHEALTEEQWRALPNPILAVAAVDAPNMFLTNAYRIGEVAPGATVLEMTGCDHWAQFEQPEEFNARTIEFLRRER
ncbi:alpha/beta fold hydrolase [Nonomuraea wenchangensis]